MNLKGRGIFHNLDNKRGREILEHLDIFRFTKVDLEITKNPQIDDLIPE
jgi:hypothetical protein